MHFVDHLCLALLLVGVPLYSAWSWRRWLAKLAAGTRPRRLGLYFGSMVQLWLLFALITGVWWWFGRPPELLGFRAAGGAGFWLAAVLVALATAAFLHSWRSMRAAEVQDRRRYRREIGEVGHLMPRDGKEYAAFFALSVTAGVVEETVFRGWLLWYLDGWMPLWAAVVVSSAVFGLAHVYQGPAGIAKTAVIGLLLALLYLLSGSLWLPILAHAMVDILQGATMLELYRRVPDEEAGGRPAADIE